MTGKTHQIIGLTVGLGYYLTQIEPQYSPATLGAVIFVSHFLSLIPDFDQWTAEFWDSIPYGHVVGRVADPFLSHRGFTHSLLGFAIIGALSKYLLSFFPQYWGIDINLVWISGMIAYASHLSFDIITVEGIPLLFPWKRSFGIPPKPFDGLRIMTGKWFENLIIFPLINFVLINLIWRNWGILQKILFK